MWKRSEKEKQQRVDTRRRVAQKLGPTARGKSESNSSLRCWRLPTETIGRWQRESLSLPQCRHLFVLTRPRTLVPTWPIRVLNSSTQENVHLIIPRPAGRREEIELVGLTWVCLQLNCCCDSQSNYTYIMWFSSRPRSPVKHSVLCKYNTYYAIKQLGATSRFAC